MTTASTSAAKVEANMRHIMRHECRDNPKPLPYTTITRGFESFAFPKIVSSQPRLLQAPSRSYLLQLCQFNNLVIDVQVKELKDSHLVVKQKSLLAARELLATPVSYMGYISAGITPAVVALLEVRVLLCGMC